MPIQSVCVYCSSANTAPESYRKLARDVGVALARQGMTVVYGGGHVGLMGVVADAALEAGGRVIGVIPQSLREREYQHEGLTELHIVPDLHTRKRMMMTKSDAFVVLPGALGTMDELFDVLTWKRLDLHTKPVILFNHEGYWDSLRAMIEHTIGEHLAQPRDCTLFDVVANTAEMMAVLSRAPAPAHAAVEQM